MADGEEIVTPVRTVHGRNCDLVDTAFLMAQLGHTKEATKVSNTCQAANNDAQLVLILMKAYFAEEEEEEKEQAAWEAAYKAEENGNLCCFECRKVEENTWLDDVPEKYICGDCEWDGYVPPSPKACEWTHEERLMYDETYMPGW